MDRTEVSRNIGGVTGRHEFSGWVLMKMCGEDGTLSNAEVDLSGSTVRPHSHSASLLLPLHLVKGNAAATRFDAGNS